MEVFLLSLYAFLRPILSMQIGGLELFELAAIVLFLLMTAALMANLSVQRQLSLSPVDLWMLAFIIWCLATYAIYPEDANLRETIRLLIPLVGYIVAGNVLSSERDYLRVIQWMIWGFAVAVTINTAVIASGGGIESVSYWTQVARWKGVYDGAHSLGHNMLFGIFLLGVYFVLQRRFRSAEKKRRAVWKKAVLGLVVMGSVFCLAMSQARTAIVGLAIFLIGYGYVYHRRAWFYGLALVVVAGVLVAPKVAPILFHDAYYVAAGKGTEDDLASGRPKIWEAHWNMLMSAPLDKKLAGIGVGNRAALVNNPLGVWSSHNDWLELLVQTGFVGAALYLAIQIALFMRILRIPGEERYVFLVIFFAVAVMNFVSNSYVTRFGLAQLYFLLMAYVEITAKHRPIAAIDESNAVNPSDRTTDSTRAWVPKFRSR